jgi:hypothetical protein
MPVWAAAVVSGAGHGEFVEADLRFHRVLVGASAAHG